ncbi:MAG TPA: hypothetical protein VHC67_14765 [Gaiellaceae bacterium]|jgi:hypothetical protein|nr:hypothetical protein [Gaiellaceae bacterium]
MVVRRIVPVFIAVLAAAALTTDVSARTQTRTVATATAGAYRAVVTAAKTSAGPAPTAKVTVVAYVRSGSRWKHVGSHRLSGTFFWKTITAPHGLCTLAVVRKPAPVHVVVQPLITPSIGCGSRVAFDF